MDYIRNISNFALLTDEEKYLLDERIGIYEYEANMQTEKAERKAIEYIFKKRLEKIWSINKSKNKQYLCIANIYYPNNISIFYIYP